MTTKNKKTAKSEIKKVLGHVSFGDMILAYREAQSISQIDLATTLQISKQDLCNIEKNRKLVSVERAVSFAKALKMPPKTFAKYALQDQLHKAGLTGEVIIQDVA